MLKGLVTFLKAEQIQRIIMRLAKDINRDYSESGQTVLICPLRGSIFFLSDLIRQLKFPVEVDFILLEVQGEQSFRIKKDISLDLKGKNVLIVEEIIDSGLALHFLQERIKLAHPANLKTVALLDKSSQRKTFTQADYIGQKIEDRFIVGYGMDLNEEGRNYPDMHNLGQ